MVLLAPLMMEVDARLAAACVDGSVAAEAQGWLRGLARDGAVRTVRWEAATQALRTLQALFLSASDVRGQESAMTEWVQRVPIAVVTAGSLGALLYVNGDRYEVRPRRALEVDPTGAGDVFAASSWRAISMTPIRGPRRRPRRAPPRCRWRAWAGARCRTPRAWRRR